MASAADGFAARAYAANHEIPPGPPAPRAQEPSAARPLRVPRGDDQVVHEARTAVEGVGEPPCRLNPVLKSRQWTRRARGMTFANPPAWTTTAGFAISFRLPRR